MTEERELIKRAAKGESGAFDEIVRRYQDGLFRHLLRLCGNAEEAEDLCQETFIRFYGALRRFNPQRPIAPYLFTIATNLGRTRAAKAVAQAQPFEQQAGEASVAEQAMARLEHREILAAVKRLSSEQQEAVSLYYDQGLSYREIAHITKVPVGTVSTRLRLALGNLRQVLAAGGAGLVIPGVGDLPQYLTSVLQGQGAAPSSIGPAVAHGISTLAPAGAGSLTFLKGAIVMKKAVYVAIGLAVVGGAAVGVPRLIKSNAPAKPPERVEIAKTEANAPTKEIGFTGESITTQDGRITESAKLYHKGAKGRKDPSGADFYIIARRDKGIFWRIFPAKKNYYKSSLGVYPAGSGKAASRSLDVDATVQGFGVGNFAFTKALLGQEEMNGFLCDKYSLTFQKASPINSMLIWFSEELQTVVRVEVMRGKSMTQVDFRNLRVADLPDSLFDLPEGYTEKQ